jgi:S-formylglutathione hydrolase
LEKKARSLGLGEDQVKVRSNEGYDHSYYTVSSFCEEHVEFHAKALGV